MKWSVKYQKKYGIDSGPAKELPEASREKIQHVCKRAYRALELSGYARIDLRLDEAGNVWVLEANPNPQIAKGEDFAASAEKVGNQLRVACCSGSSTSVCGGSRRVSRDAAPAPTQRPEQHGRRPAEHEHRPDAARDDGERQQRHAARPSRTTPAQRHQRDDAGHEQDERQHH